MITTSIERNSTGDQPPYSNNGGSQKLSGTKALVGLDWFTVTLNQAETVRKEVEWITNIFDIYAVSTGKPTQGYTHAYDLDDCGRISWHETNPRMLRSFSATGDNVRSLLARGHTPEILLHVFNANSKRFTRIDISIDFRGDGVDIADIVTAIEGGQAVMKARQYQDYVTKNVDGTVNKKGGRTIYIGSRKSNRQVRIYDKAAEQGMDGENWVRCELVTRKQFCVPLVDAILETSVVDAGKQAVKNQVDFPTVDWWAHGMQQAQAVEIGQVGRKETDRYKWLRDMVLPVLISELSMPELSSELLDEQVRAALAIARNNRRGYLKKVGQQLLKTERMYDV